MHPTRPALPLLALLVAASGCSAVKMSRVRDDYATVDRNQTKRLVVVTSPLPADDARVGELWSLIARRYVNQNRDFIAKESRVAESLASPTDACGEGLEGVLHLKPEVAKLEAKGAQVGVFAQLVRCTDGAEVWAASGGASWDSQNALYDAQRAQYVSELGEEVGPWVAPSFQLLKSVLETLPNPELNDDDVVEKIELGE